MPRGSGSNQQQTTSMRTPLRTSEWICEQQQLPNMALLSDETAQILARWICLNLPLNVYAANFGMAANMLGVGLGFDL
jgi:hypothetical protein